MSHRVIGVVRFPGTNCDQDVFLALQELGYHPRWLWHNDLFDPMTVDGIILPGGFSYGDYLRAGALAARSPIMKSIREADHRGIPILGICNGFQILCEAGLLPGALLLNEGLRFIDEWVVIKLITPNAHWAQGLEKEHLVQMPIAHAEGRYFINDSQQLWDQGQVWWVYENNPNGSLDHIAGVTNQKGNVAGLMPHPERAIAKWMGGAGGRAFF